MHPLIYRGYVYDHETGLYYLNSRYYDPSVGRFINADVLVSTGQGLLGNNMFAYCRNNPVMRVDAAGTFDKEAFDIDGNPVSDEKRDEQSSIGSNATSSISSVTNMLQQFADKVNSQIKGNGPVTGTLKHSAFKSLVDSLDIENLRTEVSYQNRSEVSHGKKGSIRFDVVMVNSGGKPIHACDFKSGNAKLSSARKYQMQQISGYDIPIDLIK